ncbi:MAG TPA: NACHT domain-containing protein [Ktedonobacteraceae bacterium]|jgi:WD40 repeat protein
MAPPVQKQDQQHPFPLWLRWLVVCLIILLILGSTVLWIIQGFQSYIPLAVLTALGILLAFFQIFPLLFPEEKQKQPPTSRPSVPENELLPAPLAHSGALVQGTTPGSQSLPDLSAAASPTRVDWGEAPHTENFHGRAREKRELEQWIVDEHCRVVLLLGVAGIGKTGLAAVAATQIKEHFSFVLWRSLQNTPPLPDLLYPVLQVLCDQQQQRLPTNADEQITLLIACLQSQRCLLILDNFDSVLKSGDRAGSYRETYEGYGTLLERVAQARHQSCLLLTSREKPREIARLQGNYLYVRTLLLAGIEKKEGVEILRDKGISGPEQTLEDLIYLYSGNPLYLKLVSEPIQEIFSGDVSLFLQQGKITFGDIRDPLEFQFTRLTREERQVIYWLAIGRDVTSLEALHEDLNLTLSISRMELIEVLTSLRRRSLVETSGSTQFLLQPVILEFLTDTFVESVSQECVDERPDLLADHSLIKAQVQDFVRESQTRLILQAVVQRLLSSMSQEQVERKLKRVLTSVRRSRVLRSSYAAGNILNILIQLQSTVSAYDFSELVICQAYVRGAMVPGLNLTRAHILRSTFTDTFGSVYALAFSARGHLLAAATITMEVRVWDALDGTPIFICQGHTSMVYGVAFCPDGTLFASGGGGYDQTVRLWEGSTGHCLYTLRGHSGEIWCVAFSPDGTLLASGGGDQTVRLWEVKTGACRTVLQGSSWVRSLAFSPDGTLLATGNDDRLIHLWQLGSEQEIQVFQGHTHRVNAVAFSPDGRWIASGSYDQTVRLWDIQSGQSGHVLQGHTGWVQAVAFSPDGHWIASGSYDQTVRLWDARSGYTRHVLQGHTSWVSAVAFSPDGQLLVSGGAEQTIRIWNVQRQQYLYTLQGYTHGMWCVAFDATGNLLASGSENRSVHLWEIATGRCLQTWQGHSDLVRTVAFSTRGDLLASGSYDQTIRLWDIRTGQTRHVLRGHKDWVRDVTFQASGDLLASASNDQTVRLWDTQTGHCVRICAGHTDQVYAVAFSPDGTLLASGGEDRTVRLWEVATGRCLRVLQGHTNRIWKVFFNRDGTLLLSGSYDSAPRVWQVQTADCLALQGHTGTVQLVGFSAQGTAVMTHSPTDKTIKHWDALTGQLLFSQALDSFGANSGAFSVNGQRFATGHVDGVIKLWDTYSGELLTIFKTDGPYKGMNISGIKGLNPAQKATLVALGAIEVTDGEQV